MSGPLKPVLSSRVANDAVERVLLQAQQQGWVKFTVMVRYNPIELTGASSIDGASDRDLDPEKVQLAVDAMREAGLAIVKRLVTDAVQE